MKKINKNGFTLIELLAVIIIMSVLVSFAIFSYSSVVKNAKEKEKTMVKSTIVSSFEQALIKEDVSCSNTISSYNFTKLSFADGLYFNNKECNSSDLTNSTISCIKSGEKRTYTINFTCNGENVLNGVAFIK